MTWSGLPEKLESRIIPEPMSGCWLWIGAQDKHGYGLIDWEGRRQQAHRVVYEQVIQVIPIGLFLDHFHCDLKGCVNPAHVRPITSGENTLRSTTTIAHQLKKRTHCKNGHLLAGDNLGTEKRSRARICLACKRAQAPYQAEWRKRNRRKCVEYTTRCRNKQKAKRDA